jgi:CheY-like chemotaxis protein/two-component sensor histidine kinase
LTATQKKCVDHILKGGEHLLELINEILDLSKIEAGRVELSPEDIALHDLLEESRSFVQPLAQRQGISINIAPSADLSIRADYTRMRQVLLNLFSNAVKYNRPNGRVDISCERLATGMVAIAVADTGIGIPKDKWAELFKPFSRLGQEGSGIEGTGIGLTITKRLIELMGGSLSFDSVAGEGTTFRVVLPSPSPAVELGDHYRAVPRIVTGGLRGTTLYIEDNPTNIELMEMVFSGLEHVRLLTATTGAAGLELARSHRPDLIILDLNLPGMDGYEIARRLGERAETRHIPIFALTAAATRSDIEKGRTANFAKYLTKPLAVDALIVAMREVFKDKAAD